MKKINQKGFSGLEVVLILVIIGLIGGVGYYIYSQRDNDKSVSQTESAKPAEGVEKPAENETKSDVPEGYSEYKNTEKGVSFYYPSDWSDKADIPNTFSEGFVAISSPGYVKGELPIGGDGVLKGALVTIGTTQPRGTDVQQDYKEPKFGIDVTNFTLDGQKAVRYYLAYEGQVYSHAVAYKDGVQYNIFMNYPTDDSEGSLAAVRQKYEPVFLKALESFRFN